MMTSQPPETQPLLPGPTAQYVHLFFMDGVGLGDEDPAVNPFVTAHMPNLTALLGEEWYLRQTGPIRTPQASLVPADARLGVPGRPQSATGQATILTGRNVPQLVGEHYGPKPNPPVAAALQTDTLFHDAVAKGGRAALITPYPPPFFEAVASGKRLLSAVPLAATTAGLSLMTVDDLRAGRAVSPDFTGRAWVEHLGYADIPVRELAAAGAHIATIAQNYTFSFFEHWPSDRAGHRGPLEQAAQHLEQIDAALGGLLAAWDSTAGLLIITSDHGNIEEKNHRQHTLNPVPVILFGVGHELYARSIQTLSDIAPVIRAALAL